MQPQRASALIARELFALIEPSMAVALAERVDFILAHAEAAADLPEVLELAGKPSEAIRALESAASLYERKGVVMAATRTRARID